MLPPRGPHARCKAAQEDPRRPQHTANGRTAIPGGPLRPEWALPQPPRRSLRVAAVSLKLMTGSRRSGRGPKGKLVMARNARSTCAWILFFLIINQDAKAWPSISKGKDLGMGKDLGSHPESFLDQVYH